MSHWTETFFGKHFREFGFDIQAPEKTHLEAEFIADALGISPGGKVLDLCCGVGRHSLVLAEMGYDVTGIDLTEYYIECAKESASKLGLSCEFLKGDMRDIRLDQLFDHFDDLIIAQLLFRQTAQLAENNPQGTFQGLVFGFHGLYEILLDPFL